MGLYGVDPILAHEATLWDLDTPEDYLRRVLAQCPAGFVDYVQEAGDVYLAYGSLSEDLYTGVAITTDQRCLPMGCVPFVMAYVILEKNREV